MPLPSRIYYHAPSPQTKSDTRRGATLSQATKLWCRSNDSTNINAMEDIIEADRFSAFDARYTGLICSMRKKKMTRVKRATLFTELDAKNSTKAKNTILERIFRRKIFPLHMGGGRSDCFSLCCFVWHYFSLVASSKISFDIFALYIYAASPMHTAAAKFIACLGSATHNICIKNALNVTAPLAASVPYW